MLGQIFETLEWLYKEVMLGLAKATVATTFVSREGRNESQIYWAGLKNLTICLIVLPITILALGVFFEKLKWVIAIDGIFLSLITLLLFFLATPIGLAVETLTGGIKGSGERYVNLVKWIILTELLAVLYISKVPVNNNPKDIALLMVAVAIIFAGLSLRRRLITIIGAIAFLFITISFVAPRNIKNFSKWVNSGGVDEIIDDLRNREKEDKIRIAKIKKGEKVEEYTSYPGRWTEIFLPPISKHYYYVMYSDSNEIRVEKFEKREWVLVSSPDKHPSPDEVLNGRSFRFISTDGKTHKVTISQQRLSFSS